MSERIVELLIVLLTLVGAGRTSSDVSQNPPATDEVEAAAPYSKDSGSDDSDSDSDPQVVRVDPDRGSAIQVPRDGPGAERSTSPAGLTEKP